MADNKKSSIVNSGTTKDGAKFVVKKDLENLSKTFENDGLTEEEMQKQRELFVAKLQVMQTNFELSKKGQ